MSTTLTGYGDNLIVLRGDLDEALYPGHVEPRGAIGFSDGSLFRFEFDSDHTWRFKLIAKGSLFDRIEPGTVSENTFDRVYFKDGLKWALLSNSEESFTLEGEMQ